MTYRKQFIAVLLGQKSDRIFITKHCTTEITDSCQQFLLS